MTTRTYALVMTTLSFIGLVTMLVAMSAMRQEREVNAEQILGEFVMEQDGLPILGNVTDFQLQDQSGAMMSLAEIGRAHV